MNKLLILNTIIKLWIELPWPEKKERKTKETVQQLLELDRNTWDHLNEWTNELFYSFKNNITYKLFPYKSYI